MFQPLHPSTPLHCEPTPFGGMDCRPIEPMDPNVAEGLQMTCAFFGLLIFALVAAGSLHSVWQRRRRRAPPPESWRPIGSDALFGEGDRVVHRRKVPPATGPGLPPLRGERPVAPVWRRGEVLGEAGAQGGVRCATVRWDDTGRVDEVPEGDLQHESLAEG